jgi:hypothetical protein
VFERCLGHDKKGSFVRDDKMIGIEAFTQDIVILHDNLTLRVVIFSLEMNNSIVITYGKAEKE